MIFFFFFKVLILIGMLGQLLDVTQFICSRYYDHIQNIELLVEVVICLLSGTVVNFLAILF